MAPPQPELTEDEHNLTITIPKELLAEIVAPFIKAVLDTANLESIVRAGVTAAEMRRMCTGRFFTHTETAAIFKISTLTLKNRRLCGHIVGIKRSGQRSYVYEREEIERVLGRPIF